MKLWNLLTLSKNKKKKPIYNFKQLKKENWIEKYKLLLSLTPNYKYSYTKAQIKNLKKKTFFSRGQANPRQALDILKNSWRNPGQALDILMDFSRNPGQALDIFRDSSRETTPLGFKVCALQACQPM